MAVRGIRGATTVDSNSREEIVSKTLELLKTIVEKNSIDIDEVASAIFSVTDEINAEFPSTAAHELGWAYTPLFCTKEISVPGSLKNCIRVLIFYNTDKKQKDIVHVFLHGAQKLRPDLWP